MLSLPHAAVGIAIASLIPDPALALPLALASHFVFDYFPHWNPHDRQFHLPPVQFLIVSDFVVAMFFTTCLAILRQSSILFFAGFLTILPDLLEAPHYLLNIDLPGIKSLVRYQKHHQFHISFLPGLASQIFITLLCISIIFR